MSFIPAFQAELEVEAAKTRDMLNCIPNDNFDWQPHTKSMKLGRLASHVAELYDWGTYTLNGTGLDFKANDYKPVAPTSKQEILDAFEKALTTFKESLSKVNETDLDVMWTLRNGDQVIFTMPRKAVLRSMVFNHIVHHRAQLGVFLRLLDIPIPGTYGPSADAN